MSAYADQRVLVVGGTSGVGLASAREFAAQGADTVIVSRNPQRIDEAVTALSGLAGPVTGQTLDIRSDDEVAKFAATAGEFDHVVVTAGETPMGRVDTLPLEAAYAAMDSKFWGAYRIARAVRPTRSLTLVSGYLSQRPSRASALQSAINAALEALVRGLALEAAPLRVNAVSPGLLRTPLWDGLDAAARDTMYSSAVQRLPLGRVGEASDVAEAVLFLAGNGYATGTTVFVDGGGMIA
ncbi:SDR family oxidoreductase [Streptomyces griseoluteus]|uniref:SDR family oxidoreductase n=1 Tax=Streptomyces griseoluteus TaxID=29306 RepID=A0A4Z1CYV6_STRGP|nr:SDR family oxidoreductase [Streptomyces griseoluteus]TGN74147.1 SDR family oxidoreductase [Streptomyces griseoluteus]GHF08427.1 short-chain dehydrogenase/reductase [Streptomyces griseoluteus]